MDEHITCLCCFGKIDRYSSKISLKCNHDYHYKCFVSMIEYDNKLSFNNCPTCSKDLEVPFYVMKETHKKNNHSCSICMEKLGYQFNVHTTECNHLYHKKCFDQWFVLKKNCPLCRQKVHKHKVNNNNIFIREIPEIKTPEPEPFELSSQMNIINNMFRTENNYERLEDLESLDPILPPLIRQVTRPELPPIEYNQVARVESSSSRLPPIAQTEPIGNLTRFLEEERPIRPSIRNIRSRRRTNIFDSARDSSSIITESPGSNDPEEE